MIKENVSLHANREKGLDALSSQLKTLHATTHACYARQHKHDHRVRRFPASTK